MPPRYQEWLTFVFDRPETPNGWYFEDGDHEFKASPTEITELITTTNTRCGVDLARYSDRQVNEGLCYIFSQCCTEVAYAIKSCSVPLELRLQAVRSVRHLYTDCFESRCAPLLDREMSSNPLNFMCCMLWDVAPIAWWEDDPDRAMFYDAILNVLEPILYSSNDACVEGALHGLGHIKFYTDERVPAVIGRFLGQRRDLRKELVEYAQACATGFIL